MTMPNVRTGNGGRYVGRPGSGNVKRRDGSYDGPPGWTAATVAPTGVGAAANHKMARMNMDGHRRLWQAHNAAVRASAAVRAHEMRMNYHEAMFAYWSELAGGATATWADPVTESEIDTAHRAIGYTKVND